MLSEKTFSFKMNELLMTFPNWKINYDDQGTMRFWYNKFDHMDEDSFVKMVDEYIDNDNFNPTIAGLKKWDVSPVKSKDQINHEKMLKDNGLL